jgi:phage protein D
VNVDLPFKFDFAPQGILLPDFKVWVEGVPLPAVVRESIAAVSVAQQTNQPASFRLQVNDPRFLLVDATEGLLAEGKRCEIAMGYLGSTLPMIEGEISAVGIELGESGGLILNMEGFDALHAGTRGTGYRQFGEHQSDSAIVREIASEMVPTAVIDETGPRNGGRIQQNVSDLEYLQELARFHNFQLWVEGRTLFFLRHRPAPPGLFSRGVNLISFSAHLSTAGHVGVVEVRGWDAARKEPIVARAVAAQSADYLKALSATGLAQIIASELGLAAKARKQVIHAQGQVNSISEAQAKADAVMAEQRRNLLSASGSVIGDPKLRVGSIVALRNMGRFSLQPYVIEQVTHQINQSGYRTSFEMRQFL